MVFHVSQIEKICKFQSIYTYKRRWNKMLDWLLKKCLTVSIHLYLQEALEFSNPSFLMIPVKEFQSIYTYKRRWNVVNSCLLKRQIFVSIHLYLQEALEYLPDKLNQERDSSFNPFIPTRGVGIEKAFKFSHFILVFQSIYTYKRRWNTNFSRINRF